MLKVNNLKVSVENKEIISGVSFEVKTGEVGVLMGPNGSGKSSLVMAIVGHPRYKVTDGQIMMKNKNITGLKPDERAKLGLFLSFQNPPAVPGVGLSHFLHMAKKNNNFSEFYKQLKTDCDNLHLEEEFLRRSLNEDFSGGEKKKLEVLQALTLNPRVAIFDEIDTGLDVDSLKLVAEKINFLKKQASVLIITHYQRLLQYVLADKVWVLKKGKIVASGNGNLVKTVEEKGYEKITA